MEEALRLFIEDGWEEVHHDVELMDASGRSLAKARLPESAAGMARRYAMVCELFGEDADTRASGTKKVMLARHVHSDRLIDALMSHAFPAVRASPHARAYYDRQPARRAGHNSALRQLANRLTGILHGCLKTRTLRDEVTAWPQHAQKTNTVT
jgi:hypothetical protein